MPDEVVTFLNHYQLGTAIVIISFFLGIIVKLCTKIKSLYDEIHEKGVNDALEEEDEKQKDETLTKCKQEVEELRTDTGRLAKEIETIEGIVKEITDTVNSVTTQSQKCIDGSKEEILTKLNGVNEQLLSHDTFNKDVLKRLKLIEESIEMLIDNDAESFVDFISNEYQRYKVKQCISMLALREIERTYKKYLAETRNGDDEFVNKMMREIRDLPISIDDEKIQ